MTEVPTPIPITTELYQYVLRHGVRESDLLRRLREETATLPRGDMQIAPEQGPLLAILVQLMGARKVLEIGTFTGYSALCIASALPADGRLTCCDISEEFTSIALRYWAESEHGGKITLKLGPALETLDTMLANGDDGTFDYVFIDADKENSVGYYDRAYRLARAGGLIVVDNTLWDGRVLDAGDSDPRTIAIRELNAKLHADERVSLSFLPFADGLTLTVKRGSTP